MNDLLPETTPAWQHLEATVADVLERYGYSEIRFPLLESTELFKRSIGEVTDIVEKEMYTFDDRNGDSLTLRPEGTASCVRACEEHGLLYNQTQRLWYTGPMFRYERPQKGRLRQFHQIGIEAFGIPGPDIDAELIMLTARLWRDLGIADLVVLQLNNLGTPAARSEYRRALVAFLLEREDELDADSKRRLHTNPLRILDSKVASTQALLNGAPVLTDYLTAESQTHFAQLQQLLSAAGIQFEINPRLVRGLDYYTDTVFEWVTTHLGAQGTVCAGGRYDGLVEQLGGKATPAVGCAMGIERLVLLLQEQNLLPSALDQTCDVYFVALGDVMPAAMALAENLRDQLPYARLILHTGGGNAKSQLKKADKSGAHLALILGEDELNQQQIVIKHLRNDQPQLTLGWSELSAQLQELLNT